MYPYAVFVVFIALIIFVVLRADKIVYIWDKDLKIKDVDQSERALVFIVSVIISAIIAVLFPVSIPLLGVYYFYNKNLNKKE